MSKDNWTPERRRIYNAEYRAKNRDRLRANDRAYYNANREKMRAYNRAYREKNRDALRARYDENIPQIRAWAAARVERNRDRLRDLKNRPCADCGNRFPPECMDFDHIRGEKRADIAQLAHYRGAVLEAELAKCELVCANCHRIRTVARRRAKKTA